ncbi:NAD(P)H-binding protein [uncultured Microbacterium sp.]|uniref:NAD(P)H-binding protein n=1 Tax=uncultured Microbacterium sp. TaxID=191216 RepID=UPI0025E13DB7|nr:NAD(P)H-binding protein [uncultured Microbacterium sp.]
MARILIFGGHGKVALLLEPLLAERGDTVTAVIRDGAQRDEVRAAGAEPVVFDVETASEESLAELISGHDAVVWSAGAGGGSAERTRAVDHDAAVRSMAAAATAGVPRYVMVSYFGASRDHGIDPSDSFYAYAEAKAAADEALRASDLEWTVLAPSRLTLDAPTGEIDAEAETSGSVSRADVARVIAQTLVEPATIHRTIRFNSGTTPIAEALASP